jgi:hypothetical protein
MNKSFVIVGFLLLIFSISSCTKKNISSSSKVDTTSLTNSDDFRVDEIDFTYFHFRSKVEYTEGKESQNFTVNGRMKKDSIIWLSITPGMGIEAVRCLILKDSVKILDRIHNKFYAYGFSYLNEMFNTNLNFNNFQALLIGNLAFEKGTKDKTVKQESLGFYLLRQNRDNLKVDNYVLTSTFKIETLEVLNVDNNSSLSLKYSEFAPLDSFTIANHIKTVVKFVDNKGEEKNTIIDIQHHKTEIVTKPLNFPFNVPKKFEDK